MIVQSGAKPAIAMAPAAGGGDGLARFLTVLWCRVD